MAVRSTVVTVTTTRVAIQDGSNASLQDTFPVTLRNDSGSTIYLGGDDVTTSNGLALPTASVISLDMGPGDVLYAVSGSSLALQVLKQRSA